MSKFKIGFIGTGVMGGGMAANLLKGGYELSIYNRTREKARALLDGGAVWKPTIAAVAAASDVVITMVSYPKDVESIYFGADGILENVKAGAYVVDMTTSSPSLAKKIYEAAKAKGVSAMDAPVSGGDVGARDGKLCIMAGGDAETFEALRPVFSLMGKSAMLQGGPGAGQQTKMCNQICIASNIMGVCESLLYAKNAGLDGEKVLETLMSGGAASWQLGAYAPRIFKGDYAPGFYIKHFVKDMRIALEEAAKMGIDTPALGLSKSLFDKLMDGGQGDLGTQALYKLYSED